LLSESMVTPELEVLRLTRGDTVVYMESTEYDHFTDAEKSFWRLCFQ